MEELELVERLVAILKNMREERTVYNNEVKSFFSIRWFAFGYDLLMTIKIGKRGGMKGQLICLNQNAQIVADRLVGYANFNPRRSLPFFTDDYRLPKKDFIWMDQYPNGSFQAAQEFVIEYFVRADRWIDVNGEAFILSVIRALELPSDEIEDLPCMVSGGAPGLGKRR
ncbi:MAG: hypothetical protein P1P90_00255 [Patescibacteria group bacterium]|nr:hypothetical protein [Patescibacteria group bacterium]